MNKQDNSWLMARSSGVLAHVSSLPGSYGIGNLGPAAREFIDFLARTGFQHWQICPLGPTSYGDSPYQSFSSFAGNPYLIDLGELIAAGLLEDSEVEPLSTLATGRVDFGALYAHFWPVLERAHERFVGRGFPDLPGCGSFSEFCSAHGDWLRPYADFMALKARFGERPWTHWPSEMRGWHEDVRDLLPASTRAVAERHEFYQYVFFGQWRRLREYAHSRGVAIIGDIPIFVALDSADTWHSRPVFKLDEDGAPTVVAGVPPDYFSASGQLWGNPLYDWEYLRRTGFSWWIERLRATFELYDIVRLDHFRGFDTYWEIPAEAETARTGVWREGPGRQFFDAVQQALPHARIIAEDLGYVTQGVVDLRRAAGFPGMKVLQFGYGHDDNNVNLPHFFPKDSVVYTGTHDNDTVLGWLAGLSPDIREQVDTYFDLRGARSAWPFIRAAFASVSNLAIIPMQDLLDLPSEARMNRPGTMGGNWQWRFGPEALAELEDQRGAMLRGWHALFDRAGDTRQRVFSAAPSSAASVEDSSKQDLDAEEAAPTLS